MARSHRYTPITGMTCCRSERRDKRAWHRRFRRQIAAAISRDEEVMPHVREVSDPWGFGKDGKRYRHKRRLGTFWTERPWKLWGK